jgi:hypothetical protein
MGYGQYSGGYIEPSRQIARTGVTGRGRVKQVFDYPQLAHVWAQQTQEHGRSPKGQMYFHVETIFSYGPHYPIARFTDATLDGKRVVLFNSEKSSNTTEKHKGCVRDALNGLPVRVFTVEHVNNQGYGADRMHAVNVAHLVDMFETSAKRLAKAHVKNWQTDRDSETWEDLQPGDVVAVRIKALRESALKVRDYCRAFGIEFPSIDLDGKTDKIREAFARYHDPKQVAKRAASQSKKGLRHWTIASHVAAFFEGVTDAKPNLHFVGYSAKQAIAEQYGFSSWSLENTIARRHAQLMNARKPRNPDSSRVTAAEWKEGKGRSIDDNGFDLPTFVRRNGNNLETSRGAECPFNHAVAAFLRAQQCRMTGKSWHRNGQQIRVGHFQVDSIDEYGNMTAGCHTLQWSEMLRLAIREVPHLVKPSFGLPVVLRA